MRDLVAGDPTLTHKEAATRMRCSVATVGRLLNDGSLDFLRRRKQRRPYASQVDYIAAAIGACRTGSIAEFAAEWKNRRPESQVA